MYKSDINFNLYKTFYDVATYGSISKAAVVNYTSQPAISRSIKTLEEQLNTKLFHRTKKGIELISNCKNDMILEERSLKEAIDGNSQLRNQTVKFKKYKKFINLYSKYGFEKAYNRTRRLNVIKQKLRENKIVYNL